MTRDEAEGRANLPAPCSSASLSSKGVGRLVAQKGDVVRTYRDKLKLAAISRYKDPAKLSWCAE